MHFPKKRIQLLMDFLWQAPLSIVSSQPWGVLFLQFEIQLASLKVFTLLGDVKRR
jgi:hypothetical protein